MKKDNYGQNIDLTTGLPHIEINDRYSATGTPYPNENSCDECDGMGNYPVQSAELNAEAVKSSTGRLIVVGQIESPGVPMPDDGWFIVQCPVCKGTRKKPDGR